MKYLVSLSGGKDSTACLLWAINTLNKKDIIPYYIDTKWEHNAVCKYFEYLEKKLNIKIKKIESEGMKALSKRKKMMPNRMMRFYTENLKVKPAQEFYKTEFIEKNIDFINILGVRREESNSGDLVDTFVKLFEPLSKVALKRSLFAGKKLTIKNNLIIEGKELANDFM